MERVEWTQTLSLLRESREAVSEGPSAQVQLFVSIKYCKQEVINKLLDIVKKLLIF